MELFLATKTGTPIIGQIASVMGWIMDGIYKMLDGLFGIQNIGLCIIIFSILIFAFMTPLQIKQQKFSKLSAIMQPEIQKIQKKYQGKKDQASMMKIFGCQCIKISLIVDNGVINRNGSDHGWTLGCQLAAKRNGISVGRKIHDGMSAHVYSFHNLLHFHVIILAVSGYTKIYIDLGAEHGVIAGDAVAFDDVWDGLDEGIEVFFLVGFYFQVDECFYMITEKYRVDLGVVACDQPVFFEVFDPGGNSGG